MPFKAAYAGQSDDRERRQDLSADPPPKAENPRDVVLHLHFVTSGESGMGSGSVDTGARPGSAGRKTGD
jgi:hypothetical protein